MISRVANILEDRQKALDVVQALRDATEPAADIDAETAEWAAAYVEREGSALMDLEPMQKRALARELIAAADLVDALIGAHMIGTDKAAELTGLDDSHIRRLARNGLIDGAKLEKRKGWPGAGRWLVPLAWARDHETNAEKIARLSEADPDASNAEIARRAGLSSQTVARYRSTTDQ